MSIHGQRIEGRVRLPARLDSLSLGVEEIDDAGLGVLLSPLKRVRALHLRGTPMTDEFAQSLARRVRPEFMDLVNTGVSRSTVAAIAASIPGLRVLARSEPVGADA